jgi:sensor histidine kinase YesM
MTNLVSLARQKSDILEPTLIRLSDLLRYMLYETNEDRFPVGKEAEYLKNYVELQKLRFGDDVLVTMNDQTDQPSCTIEPMLLIPFVENAFKHGIGLVEDPFIDIHLQVNKGHLIFRVSNNYNKENLSKDKNSGIGLVNVKNRLDLLYGNDYSLAIKDSNGIYIVELKLDLVC